MRNEHQSLYEACDKYCRQYQNHQLELGNPVSKLETELMFNDCLELLNLYSSQGATIKLLVEIVEYLKAHITAKYVDMLYIAAIELLIRMRIQPMPPVGDRYLRSLKLRLEHGK